MEARLDPLFDYLNELGMDNTAIVGALVRRPNILGLDPNANIRKMVDYLTTQAGKTKEEAIGYLLTTL